MHEKDWVEFRPSPIHGMGGFARRFIAQGERVMEYRGEVITKAESQRLCQQNNVFIFFLDEEHDLNGDVPWNPARFLNHSCDPNCEAVEEDGRIWIVARRDIQAGEEITFNYGYDLENYEDYPCHCGSAHCVGYMVAEEFFPEVRRRNRRRKAGRKAHGQAEDRPDQVAGSIPPLHEDTEGAPEVGRMQEG